MQTSEVSFPYMIGIYEYAVYRYHMQTSEVSLPYMIGNMDMLKNCLSRAGVHIV